MERSDPHTTPSIKWKRGKDQDPSPVYREPLDERTLPVHVVWLCRRKPALDIIHRPRVNRRVTVEVGHC